ncbi:FKBP-type peptidyl-prolyl cis-trans isomerase [Jiulongibacter sediminis]|jgi:FKBP-type peptidyl-prolyl cis-trans isomerase|uniref:FKBP-type peptidyl-prolyl cis-trans isomerase n=1 Tax=Jiulongibacter sediminis TaxID=1605367 RepID=UPI0026F07626|nr:FKBP-type peptidyl-prolyl cis-trans isomerase [Jiulongibacter sediminis]
MIKKTTVLFITILVSNFTSLNAQTTLRNDTDSLSYAIGVSVAQSIKAQNIQPDLDIMKAAIADVLNDSELAIPAQLCGMYLQTYFQQAAEKVANENLKIGNDFLASNKTREGVMETATGLQYEILNAGGGAKPLSTDKVKVHYHGTLIDGTVFDSSVERGSPATFGVTQVIKGWVEALQMMPVGSKWKLFIPADLAYGPRGQGKIGPNSTLIFDVELLEIVQ